MSELRNVSNGQLYGLYWAVYANARPELVAVPQDLTTKTIHDASRMDFVTISEAARTVTPAVYIRNDP
jgi:hypothetical protein